jgi:hypothetical protein
VRRIDLQQLVSGADPTHRSPCARVLVNREHRSIEVLADALLCHRHLTADQVGVILSCDAGIAPIFGAPVWVS